MTDFTTNYGFAKPVFDASIWHDLVNGNFDQIDAILFAITGLGNFSGAWTNSTNYVVGDRVLDADQGSLWQCATEHTSAPSGSFADDRTVNPNNWTPITSLPSIRGEWEPETLYSTGDIVYSSTDFLFGIANQSHTSSEAPDTMRDDIAMFDIVADFETLAASLEEAISDLEEATSDLEAAVTVSIRTVTDSTTLELNDNHNIVEGNKASAMNITVPPNGDVAFPTGAHVTLTQLGAGQVTIVAGSGVTIRSRLGLKLFAQYSQATIYKRGTNEWVLSGDLIA